MRPDLSGLGLTIKRMVGNRIDVDASELVAAAERFRVAVEELQASWRALPPGIRAHFAPLEFLLDDPEKP